MKNMIKTITLLAMLTGVASAGSWSRNIYNILKRSSNMPINTVTLSSSTATQICAANSSRKVLIIENVTGGSYAISIATFAVVAGNTAHIYSVSDTDKYEDKDMAYTGAIYGLGAAGISTSTVKCIEKY